MGNGSRGGNSGLTSSGTRKRDDKELKKSKESGRKSRRRLPHPNGNGGFPNLGSLFRGGKKKPATPSGSKKAVKHPVKASTSDKIPKIKRVQAPKTSLTKQRKNNAPN